MFIDSDIKENQLLKIDPKLIDFLLVDQTTKKNIIWATTDYEYLGEAYKANKEITADLITGENGDVIKPRTNKSKEIQQQRIRDNAEVFTPAWVCNIQNNLIDDEWFGYSGAFNTVADNSWTPTKKVFFKGQHNKTWWLEYIQLNRLEITCGEAPYITSRYDATTGEVIPVKNRVGLLDRKLRLVNEHTNSRNKDNWRKYALESVKSIYAYDFQGDNVILARENILIDLAEHYDDKWGEPIPVEWLLEFAEVISWNVWQMDGLKYVTPESCREVEIPIPKISLFDSEIELKKQPCKGCQNGDIHSHNGKYCIIREWDKDTQKGKKNLSFKEIEFHKLIK